MYGYADRLVPVAKARKMLDDPAVATIRVADVAYDLER